MARVISGLDDPALPGGETAVAIGVFDGVHRGHQEILRQTVREARSLGLRAVAFTFDIHPIELFAPDKAPPYIASLSQRADLITRYGGGIDDVLVVKFDRSFAAQSPDDFVSQTLVGKLKARHVLVGSDFRYGHNRAGNVTTLLDEASRGDFAVTVVPPLTMAGERISSTRIRMAIRAGEIGSALDHLGHTFVIEGTVVRGKHLGRKLGFPTANIKPSLARQILPGAGVYAALANISDGRSVRAAASIGVNPTTDTDTAVKIEAYLMDGFSEDIYGQAIALDFRAWLRGQEKFDTLPLLVAQMERDVVSADRLLGSIPLR